ncbi:prolipoprotein diacylglyceryl transferase [Streptomyces sp. APSN-46.1]|uniref:prolipoprotein diacylglyceryl transferase n=1 Tax=Streptomyces sp. APSN-46.1 TaxID=2929049 RepID=UPI001FB34998|nr:prolipoprotein diacylglyceryl transferase [Streptomyces sp. APSN-46.1]MCJ1681187.1 prolipoprotein diacylglyceryl transferase [Streptomyces sp. APSN-46.1]
MDLAYIPSPSTGVIHLGPIPLRGYAFCIIIGVFVAVWLGNKRWIARGGKPGTVADIAVWAVPFGLVGGRLYHVITDYQLYFGEGRNWVDAFKIWEGGLGIWGAIALGAVGAWIGCRLRGIPLPAWADALAPGIAIAQAFGRWGNWFNQELYGRATDLPWAVKISEGPNRLAGTYHPTFLYESLWCLGVAALVIWADRRFKLGHGRAFALYVAAYCLGRVWIEYMRVDEAHLILGLRLNVWTSIVVFLLAVVYLVLSAKLRPGREAVVEPVASGGAGGKDAAAADGDDEPEDKSSDTASPADAAKPEGGEAGATGAKSEGKPSDTADAVPADAAEAKATVLTKDAPTAQPEGEAPEAGNR